ncbi:MAG: hypothetical protein ACKO04_05090 [Actinomycetes bacterium]
MPEKRQQHRRGQSGFTTLGLLGVVAVLIFFVGAVAMFATALSTRAAMGCDAAVQAVRTAVVAYHAQHDAYPADQDALLAAGILSEPVPEMAFTSTPSGPPVYARGPRTCLNGQGAS